MHLDMVLDDKAVNEAVRFAQRSLGGFEQVN